MFIFIYVSHCFTLFNENYPLILYSVVLIGSFAQRTSSFYFLLLMGFTYICRKVLLTYTGFLVDTVGTFPAVPCLGRPGHSESNGQWSCSSPLLLHGQCLPCSLALGYAHLERASPGPFIYLTQFSWRASGYPGWEAAQWSRAFILPRWLRIRRVLRYLWVWVSVISQDDSLYSKTQSSTGMFLW